MKLRTLPCAVLFFLCVGCASTEARVAVDPARADAISAQADATSMQQADALFQKQDFEGALALYRSEQSARPQDVVVLNKIAHCEHLLGRYERSLAAWTEMARLREQDPTARYNIACANAKLGRVDAAFAALDEALARGFRDARTLAGDTDLDALRADARFAGVVQRVRPPAPAPVAPPPAMEQFAFWVGDWDVFAPNGGRAGSSRIERILGGLRHPRELERRRRHERQELQHLRRSEAALASALGRRSRARTRLRRRAVRGRRAHAACGVDAG